MGECRWWVCVGGGCVWVVVGCDLICSNHPLVQPTDIGVRLTLLANLLAAVAAAAAADQGHDNHEHENENEGGGEEEEEEEELVDDATRTKLPAAVLALKQSAPGDLFGVAIQGLGPAQRAVLGM